MDRISCVYYINLKHRLDRFQHITNELMRLGIDTQKLKRIEATYHKKGYIGCAMSHIETLQDAILNNYDNVIVLEDDFQFVVDRPGFNESLQLLFNTHPEFNMCFLAYNLKSSRNIDDNFIEVYSSHTTSGYLIRKHFYHELLQNWNAALAQLLQDKPQILYSIDVTWMSLMGRNKGILAWKKKLGKQIASFSDIENRYANYGC